MERKNATYTKKIKKDRKPLKEKRKKARQKNMRPLYRLKLRNI